MTNLTPVMLTAKLLHDFVCFYNSTTLCPSSSSFLRQINSEVRIFAVGTNESAHLTRSTTLSAVSPADFDLKSLVQCE